MMEKLERHWSRKKTHVMKWKQKGNSHILVGELLMCLQDVAFQPYRATFSTRFHKKIVGDMKASGTPHVIKLWLGVNKGMLSMKYLHLKKSSFSVS